MGARQVWIEQASKSIWLMVTQSVAVYYVTGPHSPPRGTRLTHKQLTPEPNGCPITRLTLTHRRNPQTTVILWILGEVLSLSFELSSTMANGLFRDSAALCFPKWNVSRLLAQTLAYLTCVTGNVHGPWNSCAPWPPMTNTPGWLVSTSLISSLSSTPTPGSQAVVCALP